MREKRYECLYDSYCKQALALRNFSPDNPNKSEVIGSKARGLRPPTFMIMVVPATDGLMFGCLNVAVGYC